MIMGKTVFTFIKLVLAACFFGLAFLVMGPWLFVPVGLGALWALSIWLNEPKGTPKA